MAAYVASQIGQKAQAVQTTVAAFALLEAQPIPPKSPPPEGARVRMKKGLHLAMKAFYFVYVLARYFAFAFGSVTKPSFVRPPACASDITSATRSYATLRSARRCNSGCGLRCAASAMRACSCSRVTA